MKITKIIENLLKFGNIEGIIINGKAYHLTEEERKSFEEAARILASLVILVTNKEE